MHQKLRLVKRPFRSRSKQCVVYKCRYQKHQCPLLVKSWKSHIKWALVTSHSCFYQMISGGLRCTFMRDNEGSKARASSVQLTSFLDINYTNILLQYTKIMTIVEDINLCYCFSMTWKVLLCCRNLWKKSVSPNFPMTV